jgi:hypothetical protein
VLGTHHSFFLTHAPVHWLPVKVNASDHSQPLCLAAGCPAEHCPIVSPLQLVSPSLVPPVPRCPIPADKLEAWSKSARTWLLQISKDTLRTFPGHDRCGPCDTRQAYCSECTAETFLRRWGQRINLKDCVILHCRWHTSHHTTHRLSRCGAWQSAQCFHSELKPSEPSPLPSCRMAGEGAAALGRVLAAFTLHAPDMGYCQVRAQGS